MKGTCLENSLVQAPWEAWKKATICKHHWTHQTVFPIGETLEN